MLSSQVAQLIANSLINDKPKYKTVVPDLSELSEIEYCEGEHEYTCCPISMGEFKDGDIILQLPCGHIFNKDSIIAWVTNEKANCPICRYKLKSKEVLCEPEHPPPPPPTSAAGATSSAGAPTQDISNNVANVGQNDPSGNDNMYDSILNMITTPRERQNTVFRAYFQRALGEIINDLQQQNDIISVPDNSNNVNYISHFRNFNRHVVQRNSAHGYDNDLHDVALQTALMESMRDQNEN